MQFHSTLNHGLVQNLDRICGSTINQYSLKSKANDLNDALDWYFQIAFRSGLNWELDDSNQTSPPIDTQTLTSGTNRYKLSAFTEKIVNLIKLEILDSNSNNLSLIPETFDSFGNVIGSASGQIGDGNGGSFGDIYVNAPSGTPSHYIKYGDFIYLRPKPDYTIASGLKAYFNRPASKFNFVSCTVDAGTDIFTGANDFVAGDTVIFETDGTIPTGLTADQIYYVISASLTSTTFKVSATLGGSAVDVTNAQTSSNHSFLKTSKEPGINSMHHLALVRRAALTYQNFIKSPNYQLTLQQSLLDERMIDEYFSGRDKDVKKSLIPAYQNNR